MADNLGHTAQLQFRTGWKIVQQGDIVRGGRLVIDYDPKRMPDLRFTHGPIVFWRINAFVRFHPGGQFHTGPVIEGLPPGGPVRDHRPKSFEVEVPHDASRVELWFHSDRRELGQPGEAWDSRFGQNFWFDITGPPE
jgi:hypothetical protein